MGKLPPPSPREVTRLSDLGDLGGGESVGGEEVKERGEGWIGEDVVEERERGGGNAGREGGEDDGGE